MQLVPSTGFPTTATYDDILVDRSLLLTAHSEKASAITDYVAFYMLLATRRVWGSRPATSARQLVTRRKKEGKRRLLQLVTGWMPVWPKVAAVEAKRTRTKGRRRGEDEG